MASIREPYQKRLFFLILLCSWVIVGCFLFFQYNREREFKAQLLNEQLQLYNRGLIEAIVLGEAPARYIADNESPLSDLRVSVIDERGMVVFDNTLDSLPSANHLSRPEIQDAIAKGTGFAVRRHSQTTDNVYFYSAMESNGVIVRSAVPYSVSVTGMLSPDRGFIWFLLGVVLIMAAMAILTIYLINDREKQMHERIRVKKQLTNNINHELKTPLAAIQICIDTLRQHPDLDEAKRREIVEKCYANSLRLNSLMTDVATIARLDDGAVNIEKEMLNLRQLVKDVVAEFPNSLPIRGSIPANIEVWGNHALLSSVFRNLIQNANAYSQGTVITINAEEHEDGGVAVCLYDDGVGIPPEHIDRIFERFYRIDKGRSRAMGGTGLGLSIVRNAVSVHGGTIRAKNRPEGGLRFDFTIASRS